MSAGLRCRSTKRGVADAAYQAPVGGALTHKRIALPSRPCRMVIPIRAVQSHRQYPSCSLCSAHGSLVRTVKAVRSRPRPLATCYRSNPTRVSAGSTGTQATRGFAGRRLDG